MGYGHILRLSVLWFFLGVFYIALELLWQGYTHPAMIIVGGACGVVIGLINEYLSWDTPLWVQGLIATGIVYVVEFVSGCVLNIYLGLGLWNYDYLDILGQVTLVYLPIWFIVSIMAIFIDDLMRLVLFREDLPHYKIW